MILETIFSLFDAARYGGTDTYSHTRVRVTLGIGIIPHNCPGFRESI